MQDERNPNGERGMIVILMAVAIVALIGAGSLAVDIGSALVTKAELQNVADASSLAATRELAIIYKGLGSNTDYKQHTLTFGERSQIEAKALAFAAANKAGGLSINVGTDDVVTATYDIATGDITPADTGVRAVQVTGRRDDTQNGQIQTALGRVLGIDQLAIRANSTAALSALGTLNEGMGEFPIGIDEAWFKKNSCQGDNHIKLHPTPGSCGGWHTFFDSPASATQLKKILDKMEDGTFVSPKTVVDGETAFNFVGGSIAVRMDQLRDLWLSKGGAAWTVNVPVYQDSGCDNPNKARVIVGFARMIITNIQSNPKIDISGEVKCGITDEGEVGGSGGGGASDFGMLVGTPGMIQ